MHVVQRGGPTLYSVLAYDYGGFSNSTKKEVLTDASLVRDLVDVSDFVDDGFLKEGQQLVLWGHSLGTPENPGIRSKLCHFIFLLVRESLGVCSFVRYN